MDKKLARQYIDPYIQAIEKPKQYSTEAMN